MPTPLAGIRRQLRRLTAARFSGAGLLRLVFWSSLVLAAIVVASLQSNALFAEEPRRFGRSLVVALLALAAASHGLRRRVRLGSPAGLASQTTLLTALAVAAAAWNLSGLVFPSAPAVAAPPCEGVPIGADSHQVQTRPGGVNVRAEPAITSPQVARLGGDCTVSVDGFCLGGTPLHDAVSRDLVDVRWFRLSRVRGWDELIAVTFSGGASEERFVAAATMTTFLTDALVPRLSAEECRTAVPVPEPGPARLTRVEDEDDHAVFEVSADNTFEFGVALLVLGDIRTGNPYRKVTTWERPDEVSLIAKWRTRSTARYIREPTTVVVFGGRCFALGAPVLDGRLLSAALAYEMQTSGDLRPVPMPALEGSEVAQLAATACREDAP